MITYIFRRIKLDAVSYTHLYWIYKSFDLGQGKLLYIITLQTLLYMAVSPIPTPGNIGANELAFFNIFSTVFPKQFLGYAVLLYGGLVYYLILILSGVLTIIKMCIRDRSKQRSMGFEDRSDSCNGRECSWAW